MLGIIDMGSEFSDEVWIKEFNEFSRDFYFQRYRELSKPKFGKSSIILPSDRREIKIGINRLTKKDKNDTKSGDDLREHVLALIIIVENSIKQHYKVMKQQFTDNAIKYYQDDKIDDYNSINDNNNQDNNFALQLVEYITLFCDEDFTFQEATKIIENNQEKYEKDFIKRLFGSIVPILVEKREEKEFNDDIKNIAEDFLRHDLDMMVADVVTEKQRRGWKK